MNYANASITQLRHSGFVVFWGFFFLKLSGKLGKEWKPLTCCHPLPTQCLLPIIAALFIPQLRAKLFQLLLTGALLTDLHVLMTAQPAEPKENREPTEASN